MLVVDLGPHIANTLWRINAVMDELPEKATVAGLDDLKGRVLDAW